MQLYIPGKGQSGNGILYGRVYRGIYQEVCGWSCEGI